MFKLLEKWLSHTVRFDQTGDTGVVGLLVNVQSDYATLYTQSKQLINYPFSHIKSFSSDITEHIVDESTLDETFPTNFYELLGSLKNRMVRVENGDSSKSGVLLDVNEEYIQIMLSMKEMIYYPINQIKNISPVLVYKKSTENTDSDTEKTKTTESKNENGKPDSPQNTNTESKDSFKGISNDKGISRDNPKVLFKKDQEQRETFPEFRFPFKHESIRRSKFELKPIAKFNLKSAIQKAAHKAEPKTEHRAEPKTLPKIVQKTVQKAEPVKSNPKPSLFKKRSKRKNQRSGKTLNWRKKSFAHDIEEEE
ncbi:hypothetical protein [Effusibacillus dendaii]|uniref:Spore coat protein n=1 Tax=Effusibacillus dendaii TaxID=2743772 RepID=A0A7I8DDQ5_9BACL|nr:hypothetical protein [Effusibacillus dendaii]BCJ88328.1 hypothetical protein skT53_33130 [Effusibacillus dendaii]